MVEAKKPTYDVSIVGFGKEAAEFNHATFVKWCADNGWIGDVDKVYDDLLDKYGKPPRKKKEKAE